MQIFQKHCLIYSVIFSKYLNKSKCSNFDQISSNNSAVRTMNCLKNSK